jgi:hypothetical protein
MFPLIIEIARILKCNEGALRDYLNHPKNVELVNNALDGRVLTTTYLDRMKMHKKFLFGGISQQCAVFQPAYGKLRQPYNCSIVQHFYARHRVRLIHPYLHCIMEKFNVSGAEDRFYPIELLTLDSPLGEETVHISPLVEYPDSDGIDEISIDEATSEGEEEGTTLIIDEGREELSQPTRKNCWFCGTDNSRPMFSEVL